MIRKQYDDGKQHVHVLLYGGDTQSTALLLKALEGEVNGVIPDYILFSDLGWEPDAVYTWVHKVNDYIKKKYGREILFVDAGDIRKTTLSAIAEKKRFASMPFYTRNANDEMVVIRRQCTMEYKIQPTNRKIRQLLGYEPRKRIREVVHIWKGISTDEIQRVKPSFLKWQVAEHPLVDVLWVDRSHCIKYLEDAGLGTPPKSSCIGCPFHNNEMWLDIKKE